MSARQGAPAVSFERRGPASFALAGPLTFTTAAQIHERGLAALGVDAAPQLEVDCSGVVAADSAGLAVLIDWMGFAAHAGRQLHYRNLPSALLSLARISEVDTLLDGRERRSPGGAPAGGE